MNQRARINENSAVPVSGADYPADFKLAYRIEEVGIATGISRSQIYRHIQAGELRAKKDGAITLVLARELRRFKRWISGEVKDESKGRIYFVAAGGSGTIKIGYSENVPARVRTLQTSASERLELLSVVRGSRAEEAALHDFFSEHRLHGEWFRDDVSLTKFISGLRR